MRTLLWSLALLFFVTPSLARTQQHKRQPAQNKPNVAPNTASQSETAAEPEGESANLTLTSGTEIEVEMKTAIDLKKVQPGDPFVMRITKPVKREAKILFPKGSLITGSVDEIASDDKETRLTLVLEDVKDADTGMPSSIQAKIVSVTRIVPRQPDPEIMDVAPGTRPRASTAPQPASGPQSGATQPVAGNSSLPSATVDSNARSTAVAGPGQPAEAAARATLRVITDPADSTGPPLPGSVLSLTGGNTRIEVGTTFLLKTTADTPIAAKPTKPLG
ncbi:MAG TPA: hypothetical protein VFV34_18185 [Blastocatellia bacterium]|nr:hypothetical protein [Blastocatellia bacterium]